MRLRSIGAVSLLTTAAIAAIVDAAANSGLIPRYIAGLLFLGCLLLMLVSLGLASKDHRALLINTLLAAGSAVLAHLASSSLFVR